MIVSKDMQPFSALQSDQANFLDRLEKASQEIEKRIEENKEGNQFGLRASLWVKLLNKHVLGGTS